MTTPIKPLGDRVVVTPLEVTERMSGGVIIPDVAKEKPQQGIVVALGPDVRQHRGLAQIDADLPGGFLPYDDAPRLSEGDRVIYGKYAGTEITIEDTPYLVLKESDVIGILPPLPPERTFDALGNAVEVENGRY